MGILELIGSVVTGGATGVIGAAISNGVEYVKRKQANAHELALLAEERENLKLEISGRESVARIQGESAVMVADASTLSASLTADRATYSDGGSRWLVMVDVVRGLTRPLLTLALVFFVGILWGTSTDPTLDTRIAATVLYLATAAVLWWFGTRPPKQSS